ncbi:midline fasciclin isoform X2 [Arctopsyche grandis]|uniref:midline fasciclin isoform X2 n=1 Tax=Arctopsyche grandis TaxID=121162 RepID=UPI00406D6E3D
MIYKIASLFLLFLFVDIQANSNEDSAGNTPKISRNITPFEDWLFSRLQSGIQSIMETPKFQPQLPALVYAPKADKKKESTTEKNEYPNLENMEEIEVVSTNVQTPKPPITELVDHYLWLNSGNEGLNDMFKIFEDFSKTSHWWKGENVCVEREEDGDMKLVTYPTTAINVQWCEESLTKYECMRRVQTDSESKTLRIRYQCCYGFRRKRSGNCEKIELLPLIEKIKQLNGTEFLIMAQNLGLMLRDRNLTVFLPSNEAFTDFTKNMLESNRLEILYNTARRRRNAGGITIKELMMGHMIEGFVELSQDEIYQSVYNSTLTVNDVLIRTDELPYMVNCAKILSLDNFASNGIIYKIDRVLIPVTKSIMQIIKYRQEFSTLSQVLEKTGLAKSLDGNEIWTMLAPTNKAFDKLQKKHPQMLQKLLKGDACTINILKHHLLSVTICSAALIIDHVNIKNAMGDVITFSRNSSDFGFENKFRVEDVAVSEGDIMATNGVIHAINDLLIPDSAIPISSLLEKKNLTMFLELIRKADMLEEIDNLSNVTFIIPTDNAIKNYLKNDEWNTKIEMLFNANKIKEEDKKELSSFIYHHILPEPLRSCDLENNMMMQPFGKFSPLRVNLYSTSPLLSNYNRGTVDCAKLLHFDNQQCDNILHQVDKPLINSNLTILDWVKSNPKLTTLYKVITGSDIEIILEKRNGITFLAPTNEAFENISIANYELFTKNKYTVNLVMKQYIFEDVMCCAGLHNSPWPLTQTIRALNGHSLRTRKNKIGSSPITSCDHMGINGVIHFTNKLISANDATEVGRRGTGKFEC